MVCALRDLTLNTSSVFSCLPLKVWDLTFFKETLSHSDFFVKKKLETRQAFKPTIQMSFQETSYPHFKTGKWRFENWSYLTSPLKTSLSNIPLLNYLRTCWWWDLIKHWVDPVTKEGGRVKWQNDVPLFGLTLCSMRTKGDFKWTIEGAVIKNGSHSTEGNIGISK